MTSGFQIYPPTQREVYDFSPIYQQKIKLTGHSERQQEKHKKIKQIAYVQPLKLSGSGVGPINDKAVPVRNISRLFGIAIFTEVCDTPAVDMGFSSSIIFR
jgi:hypothetical protein